MQITSSQTIPVFTAFDKVAAEVVDLLMRCDESHINTVPFQDSWTVAQVAEHIRKSVQAVAGGLQQPGKATDRHPEERADELKGIFLNYETKFKSPEFILPGNEPFSKQALTAAMEQAFESVKTARAGASLNEIIAHPAFGEITKLELLHFVWYHTQRHLDQMKKIEQIIKTNGATKP